jgi:prolyl oligopeptidase
MKNSYLLILSIIVFWSCTDKTNKISQFEFIYPDTKKIEQIDDYFGIQVEDPYRWLEDDLSDETAEWVKEQNEVTFGYLDHIPFRDRIKDRITDLWNYEKFGEPQKKGDRYYYYKNDGLQNQFVLYVQDEIDGDAEVFLDPNTFSEDGTISLSAISFTRDGSRCAISLSESGSDWRKVVPLDTESKNILGDTLIDVKFSEISWKGNDGFYYSSYDKPEEGSQLSGITMHHKVYYHKIGTIQSEDPLIFGGEKNQRRYISAEVTEDQQYLIISAAISTSGNELYIKDLSLAQDDFIQMVNNFDNDHIFLHNEGQYLYVLTNYQAPNYKIVLVDAANPEIENWKDLVPEKDQVLQTVTFGGGKMFLNYLKDASTRIYQYDLKGNEEYEIKLPAIGTAYGFEGEKDDEKLFYTFTSFIYPTTIYTYDIKLRKSEIFRKSDVKFNPDDYEVKQVFYNSKDGTRIPMFIVHKKRIELDSSHPLLLYGYGGFNISRTPSFSLRWLTWLDMGGVFALANLRGGGEYGEKWHLAGTKLNKQNVFDDFIAAAEYLQSSGFTTTDKTTLHGGSNGGLLVGATITQRPDICGVALPAVGVLDMLRYHKFTAGAGWIYDYGCADSSKTMFEYLRGYSPVHNVKEDMNYPATLITTADHDDRVVPAHSFKFAATMQEKYSGDNPILIRIETKAGHGAGVPTSKQIDAMADMWAFSWYNMGVIPEYVKSEM